MTFSFTGYTLTGYTAWGASPGDVAGLVVSKRDADGVYGFGHPRNYDTAFPTFRMDTRYSSPKLEVESIIAAHAGDTVDIGGASANGTPTAPTALPKGWPIVAFYGWSFDGSGYVPNVPDTMTGPLYGRPAELLIRTAEAQTPTARGGTWELLSTPLGEVAPRFNMWGGPTAGVVLPGRATYEDRAGGAVYPDDATTSQNIDGVTHGFGGYVSSSQAAHSPINSHPQANAHFIASDAAVWPWAAVRKYGTQNQGLNLGYQHADDEIVFDVVQPSGTTRLWSLGVGSKMTKFGLGPTGRGSLQVARNTGDDGMVIEGMTGFAKFYAAGPSSSVHLLFQAKGVGSVFFGNATGTYMEIVGPSNPANRVQILAAASGSGKASVRVVGNDTDLDLELVGKNNGRIRFGYAAATPSNPANFVADRAIAVKDVNGNLIWLAGRSTGW